MFDLSSTSVNNHPFYLSDKPDGFHGGGSEWMQGVTKSPGYDANFAGAQNRQLRLHVDASTPPTLYYYCKSHPGMGGEIKVMGGSHSTGGAPGTGPPMGGSHSTGGGGCDSAYCTTACEPFSYCSTSPDANCMNAPNDCGMRCGGCPTATSCGRVQQGAVAPYAGIFTPDGSTTGQPMPAGSIAPSAGTFCPQGVSGSGCQASGRR